MSIKYKEAKLSTSDFIGGWYMPSDICNKFINFFDLNIDLQVKGISINANKKIYDTTIKESTDIVIQSSNNENIIGEYREHLQNILNLYLKKYNYADKVDPFYIIEDYNLQKYPKGGGYKKWHFENDGEGNSIFRHLVFMTYLNTVDDGVTHFYYQKLKTKAKKGLTLIWPSAWTHTHRGIISKTKEKYILTGWYNFKGDRK